MNETLDTAAPQSGMEIPPDTVQRLKLVLRQAYFDIDAVCGHVDCADFPREKLIETLGKIESALGESGGTIIKALWPK